MKIVFLDADTVGASPALEQIAALGEFKCYGRSTAAEAKDRVREADIAITNKVVFDRATIDAAPQLKLICVTATGVNNVDLEYAAARGIAVKNVADYSTESVTQITFMHIFDLVCHEAYWDAFVKDGSWTRSGLFTDISRSWIELSGRQIGIIGMGKIGSRVAQVAAAFGMHVVYYSTSGTGHCTDYPALTLEVLLKTSDIVSIHAPLNERTRGLIKADQFAMMKPTAILVNVGRGGIVDEADLAEALVAGTIAGAALDVFTQEPIAADHPFMKMAHPERLRLSPHIAWTSDTARATLLTRVVANIEEYLQTKS
ncbi:MAG: D-2-hydroxyacid dehydrogenase [Bacteroidales bacterium]|nr:D-2-hydroxyacid dehydrogenase [Bacteroidales bacterium]